MKDDSYVRFGRGNLSALTIPLRDGYFLTLCNFGLLEILMVINTIVVWSGEIVELY